MERRAGRLRGQLLLQAEARRDLQAFLPDFRAQLDALPEGRRVRWSLDVDPQELF
jgi:primosomal protein N' (replication factor Y)